MLHEGAERSDQIIEEVEVVVVHFGRQQQLAGTGTGLVELLRVLVRDQVVLHAVDEEGRNPDALNAGDVFEAVLDEVLEEVAGLVFDDRADRFEAGHEDDCGRISLARQERCGS